MAYVSPMADNIRPITEKESLGGLSVKEVTTNALVELLTRELAIKHTWS